MPVTIDGQTCNFLFDTGASFVVLDESYKKLLGPALSLQEAEARTGVQFTSKHIITPNGKIELEMYKSISLKLGRLQVANRFPYITADLKSLWPFSGEKFCGILGMSFLHQFRWEIDFEDASVKAYIGAEPYLGEYNSRAPILWSRSQIPQVVINLYGRNIAFDLDTGDNSSGRIKKENLIILQGYSQIIASQKQDIVTVSSVSTSREYRLKTLRFANVVYPKVVLQESDQNAIGLKFLKRHNIVFDFPFNTLYLQHHKDYVKAEALNKSGLRLILKEGKIIVFNTRSLKGALVKGIKKGDEIVSIKGINCMSLFGVRDLMKKEEGKEIHLRVKRRGKVHEAYIRLGKDPL
ncbi:aspartyl protease family protein [Sulfurimonas sp. MAG313]|nr:aspartyl protease family protein [Sulfurimonas sp. MAG313]MDF1880382.1 aspartyl protease family protein [Sulfurimonas sp. MAG313]